MRFPFTHQIFFLFLFLPCLAFSQERIIRKSSSGVEETWELVFGDEFNGKSLDTRKWNFIEGVPRDPYQEHARVWYTGENISVSNGLLKLYIKNDTVIDKPFEIWITDRMVPLKATSYFTSAEIHSKEKFHFGMYEIRCRLPKSKGLNSAFWMYGEKDGVNNEIDVFEYWDVRGPLKLAYRAKRLCRWHNMSVHYNGGMSIEGYLGDDISEGFHTFTCVWDECKIEWWVDGDLKHTVYRYEGMRGVGKSCNEFVAKRRKPAKEFVFPRDPMNIIANVAVKKDPGGPDNLNLFPLAMEIDYIRYYKKL
jgi:beta-glucanase (GH16 family)